MKKRRSTQLPPPKKKNRVSSFLAHYLMNEQRFVQASERMLLPFLYQVQKGVVTYNQSNYNPIKKTLDCTSDGWGMSLFTRVMSNRIPKTIINIKPEEKKPYLFCLESSIKILGLSRITRNRPKKPGVRKNTDMCDI